MKKKILLSLWFLVVSIVSVAQDQYSKIAIPTNDVTVLNFLINQGFTIDHLEVIDDDNIAFFVSQNELQFLEVNQIPFQVLIEDYTSYYEQLIIEDEPNLQRMVRSSEVANGFDLGSMGGFYTLAEMEAKLDEMFTDYPNLVTQKQSIGTTEEGRSIWMVKISDNPTVDEDEPTAYFDAIHHAREPLAMATTINYMFWLLENYETNAAVKYLVNNREIYFVPIVNPDGYFFNETTNPEGGGLWRKNRRVNTGSTCIGVDLNRNYEFGYATNNSCSSTDPCSGIYRGEGPFSEAESIAVRDLLSVIAPKTAFSTHSTAGSYLMPYGFDVNPPAFGIYSEWASDFLSENDYPYGVTFQMLGYTSCGTTRDYMHSENIFGWTPEIDGQGFWPPPSTIFGLVGENVYPLYYQSWISGGYVDVQSHQVIGNVIAGETFSLVVELKNTGLDIANNVTVEITDESSVFNITPQLYGNINARSRLDNSSTPFEIELPVNLVQDEINFNIVVKQDGVTNNIFGIRVFVSEKEILFFDDAESGSDAWTASGNNIPWGIVADDSYSGLQCFGDSNGGNSQNNTENFFELNTAFDFTNTTTPILSFLYKHSIAAGDNVQLQVSTDGGGNWEILESFSLNQYWRQYQKDLSNYNGFSNVKFRFSMLTNNFLPADGFYFDDFEVVNYGAELLNTTNFAHDFRLQLYPNPAKDLLNLQNTTLSNFDISVVDILGRKVIPEMQFKTKHKAISIADLPSGIYFVMAKDSWGDTQVLRFVKQ